MIWDFLLKPTKAIANLVFLRKTPSTQLSMTNKGPGELLEDPEVIELRQRLAKKRYRLQKTEDELEGVKRNVVEEARKVEALSERLKTMEEERNEARRCAIHWKVSYGKDQSSHNIVLVEKEKELAEVRKESRQTMELLQTKSSELKAAQVFLSKADSLSEADVLQMVGDLNAQISQTASSLADVLEVQNVQQGRLDQKAFDLVRGLCGPIIAEKLGNQDPELLQVALQVGITRVMSRVTTIWDWYQDLSFLDKIYSVLFASEEQAVAGRWRALTRNQLKKCQQDPTNDIIRRITSDLTCVMLCTRPAANYKQIFAFVKKQSGKRIAAIVDLGMRLNKALGSEFTSGDLAVYYGEAQMEFHEPTMDDYYDSKNTAHGTTERILGGVELGLVKTVKIYNDGEPQVVQKVLLKSKVVFPSSLFAVHS